MFLISEEIHKNANLRSNSTPSSWSSFGSPSGPFLCLSLVEQKFYVGPMHHCAGHIYTQALNLEALTARPLNSSSIPCYHVHAQSSFGFSSVLSRRLTYSPSPSPSLVAYVAHNVQQDYSLGVHRRRSR